MKKTILTTAVLIIFSVLHLRAQGDKNIVRAYLVSTGGFLPQQDLLCFYKLGSTPGKWQEATFFSFTYGSNSAFLRS